MYIRTGFFSGREVSFDQVTKIEFNSRYYSTSQCSVPVKVTLEDGEVIRGSIDWNQINLIPLPYEKTHE